MRRLLLTIKTVHNTTIKYMIRSIPFEGNINRSWGITKLASIFFKRQGYAVFFSRDRVMRVLYEERTGSKHRKKLGFSVESFLKRFFFVC